MLAYALLNQKAFQKNYSGHSLALPGRERGRDSEMVLHQVVKLLWIYMFRKIEPISFVQYILSTARQALTGQSDSEVSAEFCFVGFGEVFLKGFFFLKGTNINF